MMKPCVSLIENVPHMVSYFIDDTSASWKEELIRSWLRPGMRQPFLAYLSEQGGNRIFGHGILIEKVCSVSHRLTWWRLTQKWAVGIISRATLGLLVLNRDKMLESLWKTSVPSKIRVFFWTAQKSLPTSDVLEHSNMSTNSTCSLCGADDSSKHSLI
jgi:hypothetical protein